MLARFSCFPIQYLFIGGRRLAVPLEKAVNVMQEVSGGGGGVGGLVDSTPSLTFCLFFSSFSSFFSSYKVKTVSS